MFSEEIDEAGEAAFFVGAEVVVNVPSEVVAAEGVIVVVARVNNVIEGVEAEVAGFAKLAAQVSGVDPPAKRPDGIDERKVGQLEPGRAEVPDLVRMRTAE